MSLNIPGYKILRTLGRGGMATVYLAVQEIFEREVALKVMSKALAEDPNFGQRFFREAKIVSKLVHPNIVTVHDVGMHDGYCYLSMEYIDGKDLKHVGRRLSLREKMEMIKDITKALDYAGGKGYVHRDIKPENIMFHSSDGRAVLMDFGIARTAESDTMVTQVGTAIGTPHYMSPEQAKGKNVDSRSDIYSLGVVFYKVLAGKVPYDAESAVAIGIKHITEPVPTLPKIYAGLQPILDQMMAKDVNKRYQNAKALMADLESIDIDTIEHAATFALQASVARSNADEEMTTLSHTGDEKAEAFEVDDDHISMVDAFPDYNVANENLNDEKKAVLPWFVAAIFVMSVIVVFTHFKKPELFEPWLSHVMGETAIVSDGQQQQNVGQNPNNVNSTPKLAAASPALSDPTSTYNDPTLLPPLYEPDEPIIPSSDETSSANVGEEIVTDNVTNVVDDAGLAANLEQEKQAQIAALSNKINQLAEAYTSDDIYLSEIVSTFRKIMALVPPEHAAVERFAAFKQSEIDRLMLHASKNGSSTQLDTRIKQLQSLFPEEDEVVFTDIKDLAKKRKRVMSLILEAEAYLNQNNITKPVGRNALDSYEKALALDAENEQALEGKKQISRRLSNLAEKRYKNNKASEALKLIENALNIDADNQHAKRIRTDIMSTVDRETTIAKLLASADSKIAKKELFSPSEKAAFHDLQSVLRLDPDNATAKDELERVVDELSAKIWQLVGDEQYLQAKEAMRAPLTEFGDHERVKSLALALDEVIGEKIINAQPKIGGMTIRREPIESVNGEYSKVAANDRTIFLGFRYENFQTTTTVIQAVLMDGGKQVQIAQVPVVLEGTEGESIFRIDRPVDGFPAGVYSIEMRLGSETLNSSIFKVE
ncbi:serine/threonine-protein kinase [Agarilytica rhodophyticola]|uniref:serine/threonine-protein kinase n=1 Tax=Agarilytica rhodophyticola TaxID=1737490 RepID=UPI000B34905C|nr:serine/threonine-protein kinase [Agarilytica rhodophyticola]